MCVCVYVYVCVCVCVCVFVWGVVGRVGERRHAYGFSGTKA